MTALGNNAHLFARPERRDQLHRLFADVLGCPVTTVEYRGIEEPMLLVRFPGGGSLSIEFTAAAPDSDEPRLSAWLEIRASDAPAMMAAVLEHGVPRVEHPGHEHYFVAPGGQVFTIVPAPA